MNNATSKRERSVPPKSSVPTEKVREENFASDTELIGSPKKRKKTAVFERGNLLEKAAKIGNDVWNAGTKLGNHFKTIGRSVTWDGSKRSNVVEELLKGSEIRSWSGDRSTLERKLGTEPRKRSAGDDLDAEMDAGKVKKVKKDREEEEPKAYEWDKNPFQVRNINLYLFQEGLHFKCRLF